MLRMNPRLRCTYELVASRPALVRSRARWCPSCDKEAEYSPGHSEFFFVHDLPAAALFRALGEGQNDIFSLATTYLTVFPEGLYEVPAGRRQGDQTVKTWRSLQWLFKLAIPPRISKPTRPRVTSAFMTGSGIRGRSCSPTRRTSRRSAPPNSAPWPALNRNSTNAMSRSLAFRSIRSRTTPNGRTTSRTPQALRQTTQ